MVFENGLHQGFKCRVLYDGLSSWTTVWRSSFLLYAYFGKAHYPAPTAIAEVLDGKSAR